MKLPFNGSPVLTDRQRDRRTDTTKIISKQKEFFVAKVQKISGCVIIVLLVIIIIIMWNVKTKVIPVIIGATGTISKSFRKYVSSIPGKHEIKELQKTAILGTAHILRKVLM